MALSLNEYQDIALESAIYANIGMNLVYPALKLNGEAGEVAELVGKWWRKGIYLPGEKTKLTIPQKVELAEELGDALWYIAALAAEINFSLSEVADLNLIKVKERVKEGTVDALRH